jgi:NAD(P)-dependent dehydrogenase (short-subunit alcohol dehydrogenase family)
MTTLASFADPVTAVVLGASGGIGAAMTEILLDDARVERVHAFARQPMALGHAKLMTGQFDLLDEASIAAASALVAGPVHIIFVATGMLHAEKIQPEKSFLALNPDTLARSFAVNTIGPALVAKHFLPLLPRHQRSVFAALSARVGSIADNQLGGWHAYRAAKAALNQLIRTFSIELAHKYPQAVCVGLHPGTVDTDLSKPFQRNVVAGKLFTPDTSARHLLDVIDQLQPADSGGLFAWDGARIPF